MTNEPRINLAASVHQRLLNEARLRGRPFNELLQRYAIERFLYRLSKAPHASRFVLKGALMLSVWKAPLSRPTKDIDLLGQIGNDIETVAAVMRDVCAQEVPPDGMTFLADSVTGTRIDEDAGYKGIRIRLRGQLGKARVFVQLDVGFGDAITPSPAIVEYPVILDLPAPRLRGYSRESAIAEKFHAMATLGILNSRMKDFFDIWLLSGQFDFDGGKLSGAVRKTFEKRHTEVVALPVAFQESFGKDATKQTQWRAFVRKSKLAHAPASLDEVQGAVVSFLGPVAAALAAGRPFRGTWLAPGSWK